MRHIREVSGADERLGGVRQLGLSENKWSIK